MKASSAGRRVHTVLLLVGATAVGAAYFAAPWLDRRSSRFFEDLIGATLNLPVVSESVQTSPFSQLTLTRLRPVSAAGSRGARPDGSAADPSP